MPRLGMADEEGWSDDGQVVQLFRRSQVESDSARKPGRSASVVTTQKPWQVGVSFRDTCKKDVRVVKSELTRKGASEGKGL